MVPLPHSQPSLSQASPGPGCSLHPAETPNPGLESCHGTRKTPGGCVPSLCSLPQPSSSLAAAALLPFPVSKHLQIPAPRAPSCPHSSVFGNFPVCASSNGSGHPESRLGDVLTSPSPTSPARLVLVTRSQVATWATRAVTGIPGSCQSIRHLSQLPTEPLWPWWHPEMAVRTLSSSCHQCLVPVSIRPEQDDQKWSVSIRQSATPGVCPCCCPRRVARVLCHLSHLSRARFWS